MPARRFLSRSAASPRPYVSTPLRECPDVADPPEMVALIATRTSIRDEPENIDSRAMAHLAEIAKRYDELRRLALIRQLEEARKAHSLERRMTDAHNTARMRRIDVSHDLHIVGQMVDRARRGGRADPPAAVIRLERVEAVLDGKMVNRQVCG